MTPFEERLLKEVQLLKAELEIIKRESDKKDDHINGLIKAINKRSARKEIDIYHHKAVEPYPY